MSRDGVAVSGVRLQRWSKSSTALVAYAWWFGPIVDGIVDVDLLSVSLSGGTAPFTNVTVVDQGTTADPFYWPIPADFFRIALPLPAVQVRSNGLLAACQHVRQIGNGNTSAAALLADGRRRLRYDAPGYDGLFAPLRSPNATTAPEHLGPCAFLYVSDMTPTMTSVALKDAAPPSAGASVSIVSGDRLVISGSNFLTAADGVGIGVGGTNVGVADLNTVVLNSTMGNATAECEVVAATSTQLECIIPDRIAAGFYAVSVVIGLGRGAAAAPSSAPLFSFAPNVVSVWPLTGSRAGGVELHVYGEGLLPGSAVTVGGVPCPATSISPHRITCTVPPVSDSGFAGSTADAINAARTVSAAVVVTVPLADTPFAAGTFVYDAALTPLVTSLAPLARSSAVTGFINVTVRNVPAAAMALDASNVTVAIGNRDCELVRPPTPLSGSSLLIECILYRASQAQPLPQTAAPVVATFEGVGASANDDASAPSGGVWALDTGFRLVSVSPAVGSLGGGTTVTLTGVGFHGKVSSARVALRKLSSVQGKAAVEIACTVTSIAADGTSATCITSRVPMEADAELASIGSSDDGFVATAIMIMNDVEAPCAGVGGSACGFTMAMSATPRITSMTLSDDGSSATLTGVRLLDPLSVWIGIASATVSSVAVDGTSAVIAIPPQVTSNATVWVHSAGNGGTLGNALRSWQTRLTTPLAVTSVTAPAAGGVTSNFMSSPQGGLLLVIRGTGFSTDLSRNIVRFGSNTDSPQGYVVSANVTEVQVLAASGPSGNSAPIFLSILSGDGTGRAIGRVLVSSTFRWGVGADGVPSISGVSPRTATPGVTNITITGGGFGASRGQVSHGGVPCAVYSWTDGNVKCTVGAAAVAGVHKTMLLNPGKGYA